MTNEKTRLSDEAKPATAKVLMKQLAAIADEAIETVGDDRVNWPLYFLGKYRSCIEIAQTLGLTED